MNRFRLTARVVGLFALLAVASSGDAPAQLPPIPTQPGPRTYSDYYNEQLTQFNRPNPGNPAVWTYNQFYYHNPAVSPYMNLLRPSGYGTNAYYKYVVPEEQRRTAYADAAIESRTPRPPVASSALPAGRAAAPASSAGAYQNHWYGGRAELGL